MPRSEKLPPKQNKTPITVRLGAVKSKDRPKATKKLNKPLKNKQLFQYSNQIRIAINKSSWIRIVYYIRKVSIKISRCIGSSIRPKT